MQSKRINDDSVRNIRNQLVEFTRSFIPLTLKAHEKLDGIKKLLFPYGSLSSDKSGEIKLSKIFDPSKREKYWYNMLTGEIDPEEEIIKVKEYADLLEMIALN